MNICQASRLLARLVFSLLFVVTAIGTFGCATVSPISVSTPEVFIKEKLPVRLVVVFPQNLEEQECEMSAMIVHDCGKALKTATLLTLEKLFLSVRDVSDTSDTVKNWDRAIFVVVDELGLVNSFMKGVYGANVKFSYKITDRDGIETFSSVVGIEHRKEASLSPSNMMAFNEHNYFSTMTEEDTHKVAFLIVADITTDELLAKAIEKAMRELITQLVAAYKLDKL